MRRSPSISYSRVALPLLAAVLAACSDQPLAPQDASPATVGLSHDVIVNIMAPDSTSADFTVTPTGGTFVIGPHSVFFPDHAICDPRVSSYGRGEWDNSCTLLDEPIEIHAEVRQRDGRSWVDFSPELRFAPSEDPQQWVWIYMRTTDADDPSTLSLSILWSPAIGEPGIDESAADASLRTYVSAEKDMAYRRIKHFSGYQVRSGEDGSSESY